MTDERSKAVGLAKSLPAMSYFQKRLEMKKCDVFSYFTLRYDKLLTGAVPCTDSKMAPSFPIFPLGVRLIIMIIRDEINVLHVMSHTQVLRSVQHKDR
jgi:hypothetical protein